MLTAETVVVTPDGGRPVRWALREVRRARMSEPFVVVDAVGIRHRLGVVTALERYEPAPDAVRLVSLASGDAAVVRGATVQLYRVGRRGTDVDKLDIRGVEEWQPRLVVRTPDGREKDLGEVMHVDFAEA